MLAGNAIPMIFNEFKQPWKEISRTSPYTWSRYWRPWKWEWDDNRYFNNQLFHPIQGNFYFNAARSNGFGYYASLAFAATGSFLWECCGERRVGSWNDLLTTTLGGAALGEMLFRATSLIIDNEATGLDRIGLEALVLPLNGERFLARAIYGDWAQTENPLTRSPEQWGLSIGSGLRKTLGPPHAFFDVELRYGSVFGGRVERPFDFFGVNVQVNGRDQTIGLVQVQAHLQDWILAGSLPEQDPEGWSLRAFVSQAYDYLDSSPVPDTNLGYRYGGQSLGGGLALAFPIDTVRVTTQVQAYAVPIGAVNSLYAHYESQNNPEQERRYDFGWGGGFKGNAVVLWPALLRFSAFYQKTRLWTLNGSNVNGNETSHWVDAAAVGAKLELNEVLEFITQYRPVRWAEHWWIGVDWLWFKKRTVYTEPTFQGELNRTSQWRFMISWERTVSHGARVYY